MICIRSQSTDTKMPSLVAMAQSCATGLVRNDISRRESGGGSPTKRQEGWVAFEVGSKGLHDEFKLCLGKVLPSTLR